MDLTDNPMVLTQKGINLYNKVQAGAKLQFTKMAIGSGLLVAGDNPETFTALKQYYKDVPISSIANNTRLQKAIVSGSINNTSINQGQYVCELGLFAQDPDEGEILYSYGNAGAKKGDWIAPNASGAFGWLYQIYAAVGNTQATTVTVSSTTFDSAVASSSSAFAKIAGTNQKEINESIDKTIGLIQNTADFRTGCFTANADNTTSFTITDIPYNPNTDFIRPYYRNFPLEPGKNYSMNGAQVNLGFPIDTGEKITYDIWHFINNVPIMADGSNLQTDSTPERALTQDVKAKLNNMSNNFLLSPINLEGLTIGDFIVPNSPVIPGNITVG